MMKISRDKDSCGGGHKDVDTITRDCMNVIGPIAGQEGAFCLLAVIEKLAYDANSLTDKERALVALTLISYGTEQALKDDLMKQLAMAGKTSGTVH